MRFIASLAGALFGALFSAAALAGPADIFVDDNGSQRNVGVRDLGLGARTPICTLDASTHVCLPVGQLATVAAAASYHPTVAPGRIRALGYSTAGIGGADYCKAASQPSHSAKFSILTAAYTGHSAATVWYGLCKEEYARATVDIFGALGDSNGTTGNGTDDTAAFTASQTLGVPINLRAGAIYRTTSRVDATDGGGFVCLARATIYADPAGFTNTSTSIGPRYGTTAVVLAAQGGLTNPFTPLAKTTFRGCKIDLGGQNDGRYVSAIVARNITDLTIEGMEISNGSGGTAINVASINHGSIRNNSIHDLAYDTPGKYPFGIAVDNDPINGVHTTDLAIDGNDIARLLAGATAFAAEGFQPDAIDVLQQDSSNIVITRNKITRVGKAITSFGTSVTIANNTADRCFNYCYVLEHGADHSTVIGNTATNVGATGILLAGDTSQDTEHNLIVDNTINVVGDDSWTGFTDDHFSGLSTDTSCILTWPDVGGGITTGNVFAFNHCQPGAGGKWAYVRFGHSTATNKWLSNDGEAGTSGFVTNPNGEKGKFVKAGLDAFGGCVNVASGTTLDIFSVESNCINITGTTTIAYFGAGTDGDYRLVRFAGALQIANGAFVQLPGSTNFVTAAGDQAFVVAEPAGVNRVIPFRKSGKAIVAPACAEITDKTTAGCALVTAADAAAQRTALGIGSIATQAASSVTITGGSVTGITDLAIADGGTASSTASAARTALGLAIGTDVEAHDADLTTVAGLSPSNDDVLQRKAGTWTNRTIAQLVTDLSLGSVYQPLAANLTALAGLTSAVDKLPYFTGSGTAAVTTFSSFGRSLVDDADAATARGTLGLASGTYTPTLTNVTNLSSSTAYSAQYLQVGSEVTVSGRVDIDPTTTGSTKLGISFPVASAIGASNQCAGVGFSPGIAGQGAAVKGDQVNARAQLEWIAVDTSAQDMYFTFTYRVQ